MRIQASQSSLNFVMIEFSAIFISLLFHDVSKSIQLSAYPNAIHIVAHAPYKHNLSWKSNEHSVEFPYQNIEPDEFNTNFHSSTINPTLLYYLTHTTIIFPD